ncbi:hypothetical protein PAPYR_9618 [Paratrimastix pyriformis]|uniref:VPS9 domain-containing protein n=1 Tax=Paratrimastix pyriformis TaxID=342808 RepID=A0ABQ8U9N2_9EUKA|nr:hypothetical protein PAPYR_9618 [Paratrimastix pyriformis]
MFPVLAVAPKNYRTGQCLVISKPLKNSLVFSLDQFAVSEKDGILNICIKPTPQNPFSKSLLYRCRNSSGFLSALHEFRARAAATPANPASSPAVVATPDLAPHPAAISPQLPTAGPASQGRGVEDLPAAPLVTPVTPQSLPRAASLPVSLGSPTHAASLGLLGGSPLVASHLSLGVSLSPAPGTSPLGTAPGVAAGSPLGAPGPLAMELIPPELRNFFELNNPALVALMAPASGSPAGTLGSSPLGGPLCSPLGPPPPGSPALSAMVRRRSVRIADRIRAMTVSGAADHDLPARSALATPSRPSPSPPASGCPSPAPSSAPSVTPPPPALLTPSTPPAPITPTVPSPVAAPATGSRARLGLPRPAPTCLSGHGERSHVIPGAAPSAFPGPIDRLLGGAAVPVAGQPAPPRQAPPAHPPALPAHRGPGVRQPDGPCPIAPDGPPCHRAAAIDVAPARAATLAAARAPPTPHPTTPTTPATTPTGPRRPSMGPRPSRHPAAIAARIGRCWRATRGPQRAQRERGPSPPTRASSRSRRAARGLGRLGADRGQQPDQLRPTNIAGSSPLHQEGRTTTQAPSAAPFLVSTEPFRPSTKSIQPSRPGLQLGKQVRQFVDGVRRYILEKRRDLLLAIAAPRAGPAAAPDLGAAEAAASLLCQTDEAIRAAIERVLEGAVLEALGPRLFGLHQRDPEAIREQRAFDGVMAKVRGCSQAFFGIPAQHQSASQWGRAVGLLREIDRAQLRPHRMIEALLIRPGRLRPHPHLRGGAGPAALPIVTLNYLLQLADPGGYYLTVFASALHYLKTLRLDAQGNILDLAPPSRPARAEVLLFLRHGRPGPSSLWPGRFGARQGLELLARLPASAPQGRPHTHTHTHTHTSVFHRHPSTPRSTSIPPSLNPSIHPPPFRLGILVLIRFCFGS